MRQGLRLEPQCSNRPAVWQNLFEKLPWNLLELKSPGRCCVSGTAV
jgi:hypothetical protein